MIHKLSTVKIAKWIIAFICCIILFSLFSCSASKKAQDQVKAQNIITNNVAEKCDSCYKKGYSQGGRDYALQNQKYTPVKEYIKQPYYDTSALEEAFKLKNLAFRLRVSNANDSLTQLIVDAFNEGQSSAVKELEKFYKSNPIIRTVELENTTLINAYKDSVNHYKLLLASSNIANAVNQNAFNNEIAEKDATIKSLKLFKWLFIGLLSLWILLVILAIVKRSKNKT